MGCTTILVGKNASNDGSVMVARTDDSGANSFEAKKFVVVQPQDQPRNYHSVISGLDLELPDNPLQYTCFPDVDPHKGLWASAGINSARVAVSATETLTSNPRVLAGDPLVERVEGRGRVGEPGYVAPRPGGIGEEDLLTILLPYIHTAREGVERLGWLLQNYGTYEMNGIAIADVNEVWWVETIGGHHWMAKRLPDDCYAVIANQLGLDSFDWDDAYGEGWNHLCSPDLRDFVWNNHLDLSMASGPFNPRLAFGSHSDMDHTYNTPRVWALQRYFNPRTSVWEGPGADYHPQSDDLPWCRVPEHKITMEDVKSALSNHYQGTDFDPYGRFGDATMRGKYRPVGINRTSSVGALQLRPALPGASLGLHWVAFGSMPFNVMVPFFAGVDVTPEYLAGTTTRVSTAHHYWQNRLIAAISDAHFQQCAAVIRRYQLLVTSQARARIACADAEVAALGEAAWSGSTQVRDVLVRANQDISDLLQAATDELLNEVLFIASLKMRNAFSMDDA